MTARQVLVPAVARHAGVSLERLVGLRQAMTSMALVIEPATAGTLLSLFDGSAVLFATAATSAVAAVLTIVMPRRLGAVDTAPGQRDPLWRQLTAGVAALRHSRFLTGTVALTVGLVVVIGGLQGLVLPRYFSLLARPDLLGFVLTSLDIGMLCGTRIVAAIGSRFPRRLWMTFALLGTTVGFLLIATLISPAVVFAGAALFGVANAILGAVLVVLQAERIPDPVRGRVLNVQNACLQVAGPTGIGLAGVVAEPGSPIAAGIAVVAIWLVVATALVASRVLTDLEPDADVGITSMPTRGGSWAGPARPARRTGCTPDYPARRTAPIQ